MTYDVFVSYARASASREALSLQETLTQRGISSFFDTEAIPYGDPFPRRIKDALLGAKVFVAYVDGTYMRRPYCAKEWSAAIATYSSLAARSGSDLDTQSALEHLVVCLGDGVTELVLQKLPPPVRRRNLPAATNTDAVARRVEQVLGRVEESIGGQLAERALVRRVEEMLDGEVPLPDPGNLTLVDHVAGNPGRSLRGRFVGRSNEMWRLQGILDPEGVDPAATAARTGAVVGGAGFGKTQIAKEYLLRFGPLAYPGGLFWIDAEPSGGQADPVEGLERQWHDILAAIDPTTPSLDEMQNAGREMRRELASALRRLAENKRVLVVVDNIPEVGEDAPPPISDFCPGTGLVTVLATSRRRLGDVGPDQRLQARVLAPGPAVGLLRDGLRHDPLSEEEWQEIAQWVGHLPVVLDLLNTAMDQGGLDPTTLLESARRGSPTELSDQLYAALREVMPPNRIRGVSQAFEISYATIQPNVRTAARVLAWAAPAQIPAVLLDAVCTDLGGIATRTILDSRSILQFSEGEGGGSRPRASRGRMLFRMHRVLADFLRSRAEDPGADLGRVLHALSRVFTPEVASDVGRRSLALDLGEVASSLVANLGSVDARPTPEAGEKLLSIAWLLAKLGHNSGRREPMLAAVRMYRLCEDIWPREVHPLAWAKVQHYLCDVFRGIGWWEPGTERLELAVAAGRAALEVWTREREPYNWAAAQNNLGNALIGLAWREPNRETHYEALQAHRSALQVYTREAHPELQAGAHTDLARVLLNLGTRERGTAHLKEAVVACRMALQIRTPERSAQAWAMTQNVLGEALFEFGRRKGSAARLEDAVRAYTRVLEVYTREQLPLQWATAKQDLGRALVELGRHERGRERLVQGEMEVRQAMEEQTRERAPLQWAASQVRLAHALVELGRREVESGRLEEAVRACELALEEMTSERAAVNRASGHSILGRCLMELGRRDPEIGCLERAQAVLDEAIAGLEGDRAPLERATATWHLGNTLIARGLRERDKSRLSEGIAALRAALDAFAHEPTSLDAAKTRSDLGGALLQLAARTDDPATLDEALEECQRALERGGLERAPLEWANALVVVGMARLRRGQGDEGSRSLEKAAEDFRRALDKLSPDDAPRHWAAVQDKLGMALLGLGRRKDDVGLFQAAVEAFEQSLGKRAREADPLEWAQTQSNLGNAFQELGQRASGEERRRRFEDAVVRYQDALVECTRERSPLDWAVIQHNLGNARRIIGKDAGRADLIEQAVKTYRGALQERTREAFPLRWAMTQGDLGTALADLGRLEEGAARLHEAASAYRMALEEVTPGRALVANKLWTERLAELEELIEQRRQQASGS